MTLLKIITDYYNWKINIAYVIPETQILQRSVTCIITCILRKKEYQKIKPFWKHFKSYHLL